MPIGQQSNHQAFNKILLAYDDLLNFHSNGFKKTAFLFNRVGLGGVDMGACAILPRIIGQGRAAELLYLGRVMSADEGSAWGFYNNVVS